MLQHPLRVTRSKYHRCSKNHLARLEGTLGDWTSKSLHYQTGSRVEDKIKATAGSASASAATVSASADAAAACSAFAASASLALAAFLAALLAFLLSFFSATTSGSSALNESNVSRRGRTENAPTQTQRSMPIPRLNVFFSTSGYATIKSSWPNVQRSSLAV